MTTRPTLATLLRKGDRIVDTDGTVGTIITNPMTPKRRPGHVTFLVAANGTNYNVTVPELDRLNRESN